MYLLFLPSLLAIVVIMAIALRDTFTTPKTQPQPEAAAQPVAPAMKSAESL